MTQQNAQHKCMSPCTSDIYPRKAASNLFSIGYHGEGSIKAVFHTSANSVKYRDTRSPVLNEVVNDLL